MLERTYADLRVVDSGGTARHGRDAVGEVYNLGVAFGERAALVSGVHLEGGSGSQSQDDSQSSEKLHGNCQEVCLEVYV